jgi:SAM-dependent methyltransferase
VTQIYSHAAADKIPRLDEVVANIKQRIKNEGDTEFATAREKLEVLDGLLEFELGRYFVLNQGLDGNWSHFIAYEYPKLPENLKPKPSMERMLTEVLGDFELKVRLEMAKEILQRELKEGISILSVPCGIMAALSTLDFSKLSQFRLYGVDIDQEVIKRAKVFSEKNGVGKHTEFACKDAWNLNLENQFDLALTMGLNVFIEDSKKVIALYKSLHTTLKKGGKVLVSFMTPYSFRDPNTERDLSSLDPAAVRLQRMVVTEIVQSRVVNFCSSSQIRDQLHTAGFSKVEIHYSKCKSPNIAVGVK